MKKHPILRNLKNIQRLAQIAQILARNGFHSFLIHSGILSLLPNKEVKNAEKESIRSQAPFPMNEVPGDPASKWSIDKIKARQFKKLLEDLGPTFIKFGQVLAGREDLLDASVRAELSQLQKDVKPVSYASLKAILIEDLGHDYARHIQSIDETPIACGSIGQVHRAKLVGGKEIVLKIQRPHIQENIQADLDILEVLLEGVLKVFPDLDRFRPRELVDEFRNGLLRELDFVREAGNITRTAQVFKKNHSSLCVPEVIWECTSARILASEYVAGISPSELTQNSPNSEELFEHLVKAFLQMVFIDGFYHGDLHAGNMLLVDEKKLYLLDFGLCVHLSRASRENLAGLMDALIRENFEDLVYFLCELADPRKPIAGALLEEAMANEIAPYLSLDLNKVPIGKILWSVAQISARFDMPFPRQFVIFFKNLASLEAIGKKMHPHMHIVEHCRQFAEETASHMRHSKNWLDEFRIPAKDVGKLARYFPRVIRRILDQTYAGEFRMVLEVPDIKQVALKTERGSKRVSISIVLAACIIGGSIITLSNQEEAIISLRWLGPGMIFFAGALGLYVFFREWTNRS